MKLVFDNFMGAIPRLLPEKLPLTHAAESLNSVVEDGLCKPLKGLGASMGVTLALGTKTLFHYPVGAGFWLSFNDDADVVLSPVSGNNEGRVYWTRPSAVPQMSVFDIIATAAPYPSASYDLGVPRPVSAPVATVTGTLSSSATVDEIVGLIYVQTYVSAYGEESQPSPISATVEVGPGQAVSLSVPGTGPGGNRDIQFKRIYRDDGGLGYKFVVEIPVATTTYTDNAQPYTIQGAELETWEWDTPPAGLLGLTSLANGVLAGFVDNVVYLSEPLRPHAMPSIYRKRFIYDVVGLASFSQGAIVLTREKPFLLVGSDPLSMQDIPLDHDQGCVSKASIVDAGEYVIYAGPNGLSVAGAQGARLITGQLWETEQWKALNPESIRGYLWKGWYVGFYDTGTEQGSFMVPVNTVDHVVFTELTVDAAFVKPGESNLTVADADTLRLWNEGANLVQTRRTKVVEFNGDSVFTALRVRAESYTDTVVEVWLNGVLHATKTPTSDGMMRMAARRCRNLQLKITGSDVVRSVELAGNPWELGA